MSRLRVFEGLESLSQPYVASTVAIGTFDGVHLGHRAIIQQAIEDARAHDRPALVFTFDRHPAELLAPDRVPGYLTTSRQRIEHLASLAPDAVVVARFDRSLSEMTPDAFVQSILKAQLGAEAIVVGTNFFFAKERAGDVEYLSRHQSTFGFQLHALEPIHVNGAPASSTRIRELLREGEVAEAESILGHPFLLAGTVVQGQQLGRTLGFPTANLALEVQQVVPKDGIYAALVSLQDGRRLGGACSIGNRPTIEGAGRSIETFLFDFEEDLYGQKMELRFLRYLRPEIKFDSLEALIAQMQIDVLIAREVHSHFEKDWEEHGAI